MKRHKDDVMWLKPPFQLVLCEDLGEYVQEQGFTVTNEPLTKVEFAELWELFEEWWKECQ